MHMKSVAICLLGVCTSTVCLAQDIQTIPEGADKIVAVKQGQPAPYDGQLFDPGTALRWANWIKQYRQLIQIDRAYEQKVHQAEVDYLKLSLVQEQGKYRDVTADYQKREAALRATNSALMHQVNSPPWYQSVWFGAVAGVVVTGAAVGLGAYAVRK